MKLHDMLGYTPLTDEQVAESSRTQAVAYPLGVPRRVLDEIEDVMKQFDKQVREALEPVKPEKMMNSDVPGVLIAAGINEVLAQLGNIQRAQGFEASLRAYSALRSRAWRDGRIVFVRELDLVRDKLVDERKAADARSDMTRAAMTHVAERAQREAKTAKQFEAADNERKRREFDARREQERVSAHLAAIAQAQPVGSSMGRVLQGAVYTATPGGGLLTLGNPVTSGFAVSGVGLS